MLILSPTKFWRHFPSDSIRLSSSSRPCEKWSVWERSASSWKRKQNFSLFRTHLTLEWHRFIYTLRAFETPTTRYEWRHNLSRSNVMCMCVPFHYTTSIIIIIIMIFSFFERERVYVCLLSAVCVCGKRIFPAKIFSTAPFFPHQFHLLKDPLNHVQINEEKRLL